MTKGESDPLSERRAALDACDRFRGVLDEQGAEAFYYEVRVSRESVFDLEDSLGDQLFGAFAVEYDRAGAHVEPPPLEMVRPDMLSWPVAPSDLGVIRDAMNAMVDSFMPSDEFAEAVDPESDIALEVSERGQRTYADASLALLPIVDALLRLEGIVDADELVRLNRLSGARLLGELALSQERFAAFSSALGEFAPIELEEDIDTADVAFYNPQKNLVEAFGHFFDIDVDQKGNKRVVWKEAAAIRYGCPLTMVKGNPFRPLWNGVVGLAMHAGFWAPPETATE